MNRALIALLLLYAASLICGQSCSTGQPPSFTLEPQDAVLPLSRDGDPIGASIHCAHESPDTNLTWFRESVKIVSGATRTIHPNGTLEFTFLIDTFDLSATGIEYYCMLSNAFGSVISRTAILQSTSFDDDWEEATPGNTVVDVTLGSSILLRCDPPEANPPPEVVWLSNGAVLDTTANGNKYKILASGGGLIIGNVAASDIGPTYRCRVTNVNLYGSKDSPLTYTLNQIDRYTENLTIYDTLQDEYLLALGSTVEFTCLAIANDANNLEYFYHRTDGNPIGSNVLGPERNGSTIDRRTTMHINGITAENDGEYECIVRGVISDGEFAIILGSTTFTITVTLPPAITSVPSNQILYTGDSHTFACGASGVPAPTISYYFNAALITTGVSDGVLTLTGVTNDANTGPYQCFADNVHPDSSPLWVVTVRDPASPTLLAQSNANETVTLNSSVTLTAIVSADPGPTTTWLLDGGDLASKSIPSVNLLDDAACPKIYQVQLTVVGFDQIHSGRYTVTISNRAGMLTFNFDRSLEITPTISSEVMDLIQDEGGTASFTCSATGQPLPTISWYFNGAPINESNTMKYTISVMLLNTTTIGSTLTVMNVESSDVGTYTCNATNVVSTDISAGILTVNVVPTITAPMDGQQFNIIEGSDGSITCTATGYPVSTVVWQNSDGSSLSNNRLVSGSPVVSSTDVGNVTSVSVELMVIGAMRVDTGMYRCSANNSVSSATRIITITVQCAYTIIECPSNVTYFSGLTPLPIELTCYVTGLAIWRVNGSDYTFVSLADGALPGHSSNGTNILVNSPVNNTEYICVSLTSDGETSSDPAYIIIVGAIIEGPSNVTYFPGLTPLPVELTCNVTGLAIWRVNGADYTLASLTNGALPGHTIYNNETNILVYSPVNNTEYICVSLTNGNETSSDPAYIIIVDTVPAAVISLTGIGSDSTCIVSGEDSMLRCTYGGVPTPIPLWYKGPDEESIVDIPASNEKYVVTSISDTETELTIRNVNSEDADTYGCEVNYTVNGSVVYHWKELDVVICTLPVFTTSTESMIEVTVMEGVRFNCKGEGLPEVTYQWFYANDTGIRVNPVDGEHILMGVEAETGVNYLEIIEATDDDVGTYICVITTKLGTVENTYVLEVTESELPPQIHTHPLGSNLIIQSDSTNVTFDCMATGALSYFWIKQNGNISSTAEGINTNRLVLHNVLPSDNGCYQCVAVNEHGRNYSTCATLTVEVHPPEVNIVPEEVQTMIGGSAEFFCSASGLGANNFTYQWFLNDLPIAGQAELTLIINDVSEDNTGDYMCFVRNPYGGIGQSGVARLILDQSCPTVTVEYTGFSITWNKTLVGATVEAPCTGDNLNGTVRRRCIRNDLWEEFIECFREETRMLFDQATSLSITVNELSVTERINQTSNIATALVNITTPTQVPIYAEDINLAVNIVSTLNNVTETVVANLTANDTFFMDTVSVISNLLSEANQDNWEQLGRTSPSTSQSLVRSTEQVTRLLSETLTNDTNEAIQTRTNIVIKAERIPYDNVGTVYTFPDEDDNLTSYAGGSAQVMVPNGLLQSNATESTEFTIASTIITDNSVLRLPSGTAVPQVPSSPIFSLQIDPLPADPSTLVNHPIMMMFDVEVSTDLSEQSNVQDFTINDVSCNFYDYSLTTSNNLNQIGGWSTEGLTVDESQSNKMSVTCITTHLTSFAVLVSIQDERPPSTADKALSIISYIGCAISLACLCLSIILLCYAMHRTRDKINHLFIHLNLCIALALGLVVFIAGIENATNNKGACKFVSALLQYLFISAFCWMLCEGVMLYMMLVTVFGNKLNKRRFFFFLGWGPAIPIVAISVGVAHEHYGTDYYCWIKSDDGAIAAFIVPIVAIILVNCVFLAITLKVLLSRNKSMSAKATSNKDTVKGLLKATIILLPLLGVTWIIGILAVNEDTQVFAWIFAILNSLQGVFILLFHVLRNKQVAKEVRQGYYNVRDSETLRRLRTGSSNMGTSISGKDNTISAHDKKIQTTSFGGSTTVEGHSGTTAEKSSGQNTGALDDSVFKNRSFQEPIIEGKDAGVKEKELVEDKEPESGSHDGSEDEKKSAVKDDNFIVHLLATNPLAVQNSLN